MEKQAKLAIRLAVSNLKVALMNEHQKHVLVNKINFNLIQGKVHALVGESGSGKSITASAIMQLLPENIQCYESSRIFYDEKNLLDYSEARMHNIRGKSLALIFQDPMSSLNPVLTIGHQIAEVFFLHENTLKKNIIEKVMKLLVQVGLCEDVYHRYPHELSGGMKQRVMIAMAVALHPDILIADEPTTALDTITQRQILELLKQLIKEYQLSVLFISHDLPVIKSIADSISLMYKGEIVEESSAKDFFEGPKHPYGRLLLSSIPSYSKRNEFLAENHAEEIVPFHSDTIIFSVNDVSVKYQKKSENIVKNVSFSVKEGECFAIVGGSGSGKSTLAKALIKLLPLSGGEVFLEGKNSKAYSSKNFTHEVQLIFQDPYQSLNPKLTIQEILSEGLISQKIKKAKHPALIQHLLGEVGLPVDALWRYPHEFSGGQRQRIAIARAIAVRPKILICDEPTSALDVSVQAQILNLLRAMQSNYHLTIILITHNFSVVGYLADKVAVMHRGEIVEQGLTKNILEAPEHEYTKKLLESVYKLDE